MRSISEDWTHWDQISPIKEAAQRTFFEQGGDWLQEVGIFIRGEGLTSKVVGYDFLRTVSPHPPEMKTLQMFLRIKDPKIPVPGLWLDCTEKSFKKWITKLKFSRSFCSSFQCHIHIFYPILDCTKFSGSIWSHGKLSV